MRRLTSCYHNYPVSFLLLVSLVFVLSGCVVNKGGRTSPSILQQNNELERVNRKLVEELEQQKQLTAQLQMCLLGKYAELDRLTATQERFVHEFVHNKAKLWNRGDKVETVRFVAEVTTVIDTVKESEPTGSRKDSLLQAEQYLDESKAALDEGDFDGASHLAELALKQVDTVQFNVTADGSLQDDIVIDFATPLTMKLLKNSNVREAPSVEANVKAVLERGSLVIAIGYKGKWVKVKREEQDNGWVHYSLLSGALE